MSRLEHALIFYNFRRKALASKFTVKLTKLAYSVLLSYLVLHESQIIASIINDKIHLLKLQDNVSLSCEQEYFAVLEGYTYGNHHAILV